MIEYMLSQLNLLENNGDMAADNKSPLLDEKDKEIACEVKKFMDQMPGGFFIYRADGNEEIIYANEALLRIFMCDTMREFRQLTGNSFRGLVHPEDLEEVEKSIRKQIAESRFDLDYVEYRIIRKDGAIRWLEDYGHFVKSKSGDIFYVFVGDSTEKRERLLAERNAIIFESQAKEQEMQAVMEQYDKELKVIRQEHLRRLEVIEGLSINYDSIFYVDLDADKIVPYRISYRVGNLFHKNFEEREYSRCRKSYADAWVYHEDYPMFIQAMSPEYIRERLAEEPTFYINYRVNDKEEMLYLQMRIANAGDMSHISQIVIGFQRVDKEIQYEIEKKKVVEDALNRARAANLSRSTFLSNMSHDMRTPLNAILGFTALAKKNQDNKSALLSYMNRIEASGQQLLSLINDVLELSWMETDHIQILQEVCSIPELLEKLYGEMVSEAMEKNIAISLETAGIRDASVYCDENKLRQVLRYIVGNAIKYTGHGGSVCVAVTQSETQPNDYGVYQFKVSDTGIGISEEFQKHIFDPFEREKNTTLSGVHGVGLGLTIAKNIVEMMGGTITLHSVPGEGSQFTVTLKLRMQKGVSALSVQEEANPDGMQNRRILLVEDNEINREIETDLLESLGIIVETAENGRIAVKKMEDAPAGYYALVLMDIQMPVMDGYQATEAIRALEDPGRAQVPIVALSANAFEEDVRRAYESGMNAHVAKPFDLDYLSEAILKYIP